jgi:hypothetical protein
VAVGTSFNVNRNDLEFILKQIKIAEATSLGYTAAPKTILQAIMDANGVTAEVASQLPHGLRTVDGSFNNLIPGREKFGAADTLFPRLTDPVFRNDQDGDTMSFGPGAPAVTNTNYDPRFSTNPPGVNPDSVADADPRIISNLVVDMSIANPAAIMAALAYAGVTGADAAAALAEIQAAAADKESAQQAAAAATPAAIADLQAVVDTETVQQAAAETAYILAVAADTYRVPFQLATDAQIAIRQTIVAINALGAGLFDGPISSADIDKADAAIDAATDAVAAATESYAALVAISDPGASAALDVLNQSTSLLTALTNFRYGPTPFGGLTLNEAVEAFDELGQLSTIVSISDDALSFATVLSNTLEPLVDPEGLVDAALVALNAAKEELADAQAALNAANNADASVAEAEAALTAIANSYGLEIGTDGGLEIPNLSPDIGLSPPFNAWMTFFGQFFDHGLDLVTKGHAGTVYIPLQADDPLIAGDDGVFGTADDLPPHLQFMALTRATVTPDADGVPQHENTTTSFVDQNQTYTSHSSHQVFLREYVMTADGAVSTGRFLDGSAATGSVDGAIGNWAEVKAQAKEMLGIILDDFDVHNVPLLLTDQYGKFIPGANGYAQVATTTGFVEGTAGGLVLPANTVFSNHAFLNDIAHHAVPSFADLDHNGTKETKQVADDDLGDADGDGFANSDFDKNGVVSAAELVADDKNEGTYDDEMLNAHFVTGDGRGNENIALTAVHSIFHSEHNRLVEVNKATILESGDLAFINEWLSVDIASLDVIATAEQKAALLADVAAWDGERLFQAARFGTEMQYQHLVFEEFARRVQPMVDPFIFNSSVDLDPAIVAEFAHTVYRFGHSMLTGTVDRLDNNLNLLNGGIDQPTLLAVFLNPQGYVGSGATLEEINANLIRGLSRDVGNAIDEFIVADVRSNLLGLPLDLAALNIARGRDTGIPSLNETRAQLYDGTGLADLKPYASWYDFALNIKNAASIVNFIAAYGTHDNITNASTLADKRAAAEAIVFNTAAAPTDRLDFLNGTGEYATDLGGLNDVDLWIGGLAEASPEFGGMLGTTFNFVFEYQMEALQFGDRLYYLTRTQGLNFLNQLEPNTFADLVMRNTELGDDYATHLNGQLFVTPDHIIELDRGIAQEDYNGTEPGNDPIWDEPNSILGSKISRDYTGASQITVDGVVHDVGGYLRAQGGEHYVLGGTEGNDRIYGDKGIDTLWGDGGDDYLNGGTESDDVFGGEGDDIIEDPFGDDVLRGQHGNDVITSSRGADLMFGGEGSDVLMLGQDAAEAFGDEGDDFILGGAGKDFILGNEGDDWIEGGAGFDTLAGENSELFFNSSIIGHDVLFGHGDETDYDAESGDDIMGSGPSVFRYEGMFGFDWGIAKNDIAGVKFDLQIPIFTTIPNDVLKDRFDQVEALSGWNYDDHLDGDDRGHKGGGSSAPDSIPTELFAEHLLTQEGIDRIDGMQEWIAGARQTLFGGASPVPGSTVVTTFRDGNILLGGDGNDFLRGRGGYDILDGDAWLNVRIKIVVNGKTYSAESMSTDTAVAGQYAGKVYNTDEDGNPVFTSVAFGGRSLTSLLLDRTINPGDLSIVREIKYDDTNVSGPGQNIDTVFFQGTMAEYAIEGLVTDGINYTGDVITQAHDVNGDGFISVRDKDTGAVGAIITGPDGQPLQLPSSRGLLTDDHDLLKNIEQLQFADRSFLIGGPNQSASGTVTIADPTPFDGKVTPYVGQQLTASSVLYDPDNDADGDGDLLDAGDTPIGPVSYEWETTEFGNNSGWSLITTANPYTVRSVDPGHILRAVAVFQDKNGVTERVYSTPTDNPTVAFSVSENSPTGTIVGLQIPFSVDYDPESFNGQPPPDVDLTTLYHEIDPANNAGGRFKVVLNGTDFNGFPRYSLVVDQGGPENLDYEAVQTPVDNQYQVVVNTYSDLPANGGVLTAVRQFTIFLSNVVEPPFAIQWRGVTSGNGLPQAGTVIANLSSTDADTTSGFVYALEAGSSAAFTVDPAGAVMRTGSAIATNTPHTLNVSSTDPTGATRTQTFNIQTGTDGITTVGTTSDDGRYSLYGWDAANQATWRDYWINYDNLGRATAETLTYDDNHWTEFAWDVANQGSWSDYWINFDSLGRATAERLNYDDGRFTLYGWDAASQASWSDYWINYDNLGRATAEQLNYDDGHYTLFGWDAANQSSWRDYWINYDNLGRATAEQLTYDDGHYTLFGWDAANQSSWRDYWINYDSLGRATAETLTYDSGHRTDFAWDAAGQASWSDYWINYDDLGRATQEQLNYDDGRSTLYGWDAANEFAWSSYIYDYDAQGKLISQSGVYDNGTTWLI